MSIIKQKLTIRTKKANKVAISESALSRTTLWCLKPGQHIHPHVHAGDHIWIVLEGEGRLLGVAGEPELSPGITATLLPANRTGWSTPVQSVWCF